MILIYLVQNSMELGPEAIANMGQATRMGARLALPMWQKAVYEALETQEPIMDRAELSR